MRRIALVLAAMAAAFLVLVIPAGAITNGQPDGGEHPYVGELIFFDADAIDPVRRSSAWFSCSATMLKLAVLVTAGHCTYGVGLDGESTTTGDEDGSGGNDIWFDFGEEAHFGGFPAGSDYDRDESDQRYMEPRRVPERGPFWHRGTVLSASGLRPQPVLLADAGVVAWTRRS